tara:strand:+ start:2186 stop:2950 length:765 start_codon:yes stop_codon:yes gene_type:complete
MIYQKFLPNIIQLRESLVSNNINRILIGLLLVLVILTIYNYKLDKSFIITISILITYDLFKIKIINKYILPLIAIFPIFCFLFIQYEKFEYLFYIQILIVISIILFKRFKNFFFIVSLYTFSLILFYIINFDRNIFYLIILVSFFNDTIAYISGKYIGGPNIVPNISPKKTWSGTLVSFLATSVLIYNLNYSILFSMILSISLFFGDIFFSFIKRYLNLKDFSSLLKSHGGVLDRLDSMFFFAIIIQIYLVYLK